MQFDEPNPADRPKAGHTVWPAVLLTFSMLFTCAWIGMLAWITVWLLA
jgi:hypothetical protein